jgi:hypothetical protein
LARLPMLSILIVLILLLLFSGAVMRVIINVIGYSLGIISIIIGIISIIIGIFIILGELIYEKFRNFIRRNF